MGQQYRPELYAVLEAIARGIDNKDKISEELELPETMVEEILRSLEAAGLITRSTKGIIVKRETYSLTPSGWRKLDEWRDRAASDLKKAEELRKTGREEEAIEILQPYLAFLPFLLALEHLSMVGLHDLLTPRNLYSDQLDISAEESGEDFESAEEF
ncbi:MAG TPA: helix-turn-helix domain-containing protein [Sulfolobales archaeon]|nr:helix-turn-helix domain-containing protein [Sulfolobales archaeon]